MSQEVLKVENLVKHFELSTFFSFSGARGHVLKAIDNITFSIRKGETFGLVGESGSGKSTTARVITRLETATEGNVYFKDREIMGLSRVELRKLRRKIQMIFQDPFTSLNPRMRIGDVLGNPLRINKILPRPLIEERVVELLKMVGLMPEHRFRYPHEFSGGQRQRICTARAMALEPDFIIADEAVSGLDVSVRAQILNLFRQLQEMRELTYLFIAHDLSVVEHFCDRIAVMYGGKFVEVGPVGELFTAPLHPYTEALISAIPEPNPRMNYRPRILKGEIVSLINRPPGCIFQSRCPMAKGMCNEAEPPMKEKSPERWVACHFR